MILPHDGDGLMHEPLHVHRRHELPRVADDRVPLHKVESLAVVSAQYINVLAVCACNSGEGASGSIHAPHVNPLLPLEVKLLYRCEILPSIIPSYCIDSVG